MKKILFFLMCLIGISCCSMAQTKLEKRYEYTLKKLNLDKATQTKFSPILLNYLKEKKAANDPYDELKDKYKSVEKAGTLTDAQATQLLNAKFESDTKELAIKKKYYAEFQKVLKPKKVYYAFDYASEKLSKIEEK